MSQLAFSDGMSLPRGRSRGRHCKNFIFMIRIICTLVILEKKKNTQEDEVGLGAAISDTKECF